LRARRLLLWSRMGKGSRVGRLLLACLLAASPSLARAAEPVPSPDAALSPPPKLTPAEQQHEIDLLLKAPMTEQRKVPMDPELGIATAAFFADFGLRLAEGMLAILPFGVFICSGCEGRQSVPTEDVVLIFTFSGALLLTTPLLNAFVVQAIGNGGHYHRPFVPLVIASYATCMTVDALTILIGFTNGGYGVLAYFLGSIAGSTIMTIVQDQTREPFPEGTIAQPKPAARGLTFAF
jgi:hypothetical protein